MEASSLSGLLKALGDWGVDADQARRTVADYRRYVTLKDTSVALDAPTGRGGVPAPPLVEGEGPYFAMEVQPS
jgi:hypothetical protein